MLHRFTCHLALALAVLMGFAAIGFAPAADAHPGHDHHYSAHAETDANPPVLLAAAEPGNYGAGSGDAEGKAKAESGSLLAFDFGSYIWKLIIFTVFFVLLAKFVWPPILKGLQDRENKQRTDLQNAEKAAKEATATLEQYKQQLAEARKEAQDMINQARADADKAGQARKAEIEREIGQLRERTTKEIAAAKETALADIYEQAAVISTQIAGQILKRELNPQDQQGLVTESLQQIQNDASRN
ncbi:MAG: F0F1 ATP synthase subunit B [Planctomycetota bacterium]